MGSSLSPTWRGWHGCLLVMLLLSTYTGKMCTMLAIGASLLKLTN
jgi:hypothetical protein